VSGSWTRNVEPFFPADVAALFSCCGSILGEKEMYRVVLAHFWVVHVECCAEIIAGEDGSAGGFGTRGLDDFPVDEPSVSAKLIGLADSEFGRAACDDEVATASVEA